jgi:hypothetical protein
MPSHQLVKQWPAVRSWLYDLAIQNGRPTGEILTNGLRERLERLEHIPVARYQLAGAALHIRHRR